jgi:hypothetical protein
MAKYAEVLKQSDKEVAEATVAGAVANGKASVQKEIADLTAKGTTLDLAYNAAVRSNPFNFAKIKQLTAEKAANASDLAFAQQVLTDLF